MPERCGRNFDEALLTGYLDRVLTQSDEQRVRVHLEDCATCRAAVDDMKRLREVTMSTPSLTCRPMTSGRSYRGAAPAASL